MLEIRTTRDGSTTLFVPELNENYHSVHGAETESLWVYIQEGFDKLPGPLNILEIGFGTGLNALLTVIAIETSHKQVHYTTLETFPIKQEILNELKFNSLATHKSLFNQIHDAPWGVESLINNNFTLLKLNKSLQEAELQGQYNLVYFDAFAPEKQSEMWELPVFEKLFNHMQPAGMLVTYCAKGVVKRTLKAAGFNVIGVPGPPGKREMTVAIKP